MFLSLLLVSCPYYGFQFCGLFPCISVCTHAYVSASIYFSSAFSLTLLFALCYSGLSVSILFYFISLQFLDASCIPWKECRFAWVVKYAWAGRSSKRGNHSQNTTLWKKKLLLITKKGLQQKVFLWMTIFNPAAIVLLPIHYVQIKQLVWVHPFIHNHILLIIIFQIEKMDISFKFQNSLGLLFKLCEAWYSEKNVNKSQKRISAGQI